MSNISPPLPSEPPAWEPIHNRTPDNQDSDGPAWVCHRCTFDNHPLMNKCEQCDMPKVQQNNNQGTNNIRPSNTNPDNVLRNLRSRFYVERR